MSLTAQQTDTNPIGYFRIYAQPPGGVRREITIFRGVPLKLDSATTTDPFSESVAQMSLAQVTVFDNPGSGDLDWLVPDCDIDIVWENYGPYDFTWSWEGYIASYNLSIAPGQMSFSVDLKGALYALDNYLAKPRFPRRPVPYEVLIRQAFDQDQHPARLGSLKITFPQGWKTVMGEYKADYLKPTGVTTGQKWTGLTSRNTGSWEPVLTGHVQSLLGVMFSEGNSQWTIRNRGNRKPELFLRREPDSNDPDIIEITLGAPGVGFDANRDFTQSANTIYGQGKDEAGITYTGMGVTPNGETNYRPYAYSPLTYPRGNNPTRDARKRPKETLIRFTDGLDEVSATKVAQSHLKRFSDPGMTGTISLSTDVRTADGKPFPRMLITAGRTVRIKGLFGINEGVLVHITNAAVNFNDLTVQLSYDSKYRDQLTVEEVKARTRDAMDPLRTLQVGKYSNTLQDLLFPWSYKDGSGIIPSGGSLSAKEFFNEKLPENATFPYEEWTRKYPPRKYPNYYVKIGPTDTENSTNNWSGIMRNGQKLLAVPVRMAQAGQIRLTQIAAYDKDGNVMPVRFHVSFYKNNGVSPSAMPEFPPGFNFNTTPKKWLPPKGITVNYKVGNENPFFENAWEAIMPDGTERPSDSYVNRLGSELVVGWGNYFEPAGYSPGRFTRGAERTGKLEDSTTWDFNMTELFDPLGVLPLQPDAGTLFVMIYCDEQGDEPVYFMGRLFRTEPGAT